MDYTATLRKTAALSVAAIVTLAGCAGTAPPASELPRCFEPETLVCVGKRATRVDRRHRLEEVEFCHCERVGL